MLSELHLITPSKISLVIHEDQLAFLHCLAYELCKLFFGCAWVGCGDASADLVVVQVHCFAASRIARLPLVRGGECLRPFVSEFLGKQCIPIGMTKGIAVPVIELPLLGLFLWNTVGNWLVWDVPLAFAKSQIVCFLEFEQALQTSAPGHLVQEFPLGFGDIHRRRKRDIHLSR
ncbi:hypothetical protein DZD52_10450 [Xanthomonas nasturtii]|uniref:Uncharacterized protein n=1 Tax=Xanthomonas nasturtii TaxID=1843581 RepID=A0A3E1KKC6_9XANT|nr:hypothetical protein DZD52_10450 [Xanthomonas nasturtii]